MLLVQVGVAPPNAFLELHASVDALLARRGESEAVVGYSLLHGARIVAEVLHSPELFALWIEELDLMRERVSEMRYGLRKSLESSLNRSFESITDQNGLFSYIGLDEQGAVRLRDEWGIYLPLNGRINIAGLTPHNLPRVADALTSILRR